ERRGFRQFSFESRRAAVRESTGTLPTTRTGLPRLSAVQQRTYLLRFVKGRRGACVRNRKTRMNGKFARMSRRIGLVAAVLLLGFEGNGWGGGSSSKKPPAVAVVLSPSAQAMDQGQTVSVTASVTNDAQNKGVTWSMSGTPCSGAACGTLSARTATSVTYNAPSTVSGTTAIALTAT